jgi:hypothetical protein
VVKTFVSRGRAACRDPRLSRSREELARDGDFSCEAESCRARRRLLGGGPSSRELSEMLPSGRRLGVLPVRVLIGVLGPPRTESLDFTLSILTFTLSMVSENLVS